MRLSLACTVVLIATSLTGCVSDQTHRMAETCQRLLGTTDRSAVRSFLQDAQEHLASLNGAPNPIEKLARNAQDPDAMRHKQTLEECLWRLNSQQG